MRAENAPTQVECDQPATLERRLALRAPVRNPECTGARAGSNTTEQAAKAGRRLEQLRIERTGLTAAIELAVADLARGERPCDVIATMRQRLDNLASVAPPTKGRPDAPWCRPVPPDPLGLRGLNGLMRQLAEQRDDNYYTTAWWQEEAGT